MDATKQVARRIVIKYPVNLVGEPLIYRLAKDYGLVFNILRANVNPEAEGVLVLELRGTDAACAEGIEFLSSAGVDVQPLSMHIRRDEEACTHCGLCASVCPTGALVVNQATQLVDFIQEQCIACGLCVRACPMKAMRVEF